MELARDFICILNEQSYNYLDSVKFFKIKILEQIKWINCPEIFGESESTRLKILINLISFSLKEKSFLVGNNLITEGEQTDSIIFIIDGKVDITIKDHEEKVQKIDSL